MRYNVKDTTKITDNYGKEVLKSRGVKDLDAFLHPTEEQLQDWHDLTNIHTAAKYVREVLKKDNPKFALVVD